ncbi:Y-family DNA polymerase [Actinobaculum suis]|uniref:Y-family DNA polymerase n=1 Tax=Actinobaculum suis TaxID=1657 RepID=UPI0008087BEC|nr:DNA polymerase Y family protein [Actinobaculum suis]OCA93715.1 hypothetical protein ACU20_07610 [Actinobaculum suis]OCA94008.1 hypothetical protein ACU21_07565 [Actinobaculum suis]
MRYGSVWVPHWPITAAVQAGLLPVAAPAAVAAGREIIAANPWARGYGIHPGMPQREAESICPQLALVPADTQRDMQFFEPVVQAIDTLVARVTVRLPGSVIFPARSATRTAGSEAILAESLLGAVADIAGCEANVGFAQGTLATLLAAREDTTIAPGEESAYLAAQPLAAVLVVPTTPQHYAEFHHCVELLSRLGIQTIGQAQKLGARALTARFGSTGQELAQLIAGDDMAMPLGARVVPEIRVHRNFDPPLVNAQQAAFAARQLALELEEKLAATSYTAHRLAVHAHLETAETVSREWLVEHMAARDVVDRVRWQLSAWMSTANADRANISQLELVVTDFAPAGSLARPLWGGKTASAESAARGATRIQALLGEEAVLSPVLRGGRRPEDLLSYVPFGHTPATAHGHPPATTNANVHLPAVAGNHLLATENSDRAESTSLNFAQNVTWPGAIPAPRPLTMYGHPRKIRVLCACGALLAVNANSSFVCPHCSARADIDTSEDTRRNIGESMPAQMRANIGTDAATDTGEEIGEEIGEEVGKSTCRQVFPAHAEIDEHRYLVTDWAGPWALEERWWDPARRVRRAYLQITTEQNAYLTYVEGGEWQLAGSYS